MGLFSSCFPSKSQPEEPHNPHRNCVFCHVSPERGFNISWEDDKFVAFADRSPACEHHLLLVPKDHISSVRSLSKSDVSLIQEMQEIGIRILDGLNVPPAQRRLGFHIPPFNSINHLHLHLQSLPYKSVFEKAKYPPCPGKKGKTKGFGWFVQVGQVIQILEQDGRVGVFAC